MVDDSSRQAFHGALDGGALLGDAFAAIGGAHIDLVQLDRSAVGWGIEGY